MWLGRCGAGGGAGWLRTSTAALPPCRPGSTHLAGRRHEVPAEVCKDGTLLIANQASWHTCTQPQGEGRAQFAGMGAAMKWA